MSSLEEKWHSLIEGRGSLIHGLLRVASWGYGGVVSLRNSGYDHNVLKTHTLLPTISVGNLRVGGSGKTPLVRWIARKLKGKVAILSRGYRGLAEKRTLPTLVTPDSNWEVVGDEPLLLARSLPEAYVIVSPDRVKGAQLAKELGAGLLLLDDGFQHRALGRTVDIVCIPASTPLADLALFPRGPLREPLSALRRATHIAVTECEDQIPEVLAAEIGRHTSAPQIGFSAKAEVEGADIRGKRVAIFCGIARPERLRKSIERLGGQVVDALYLPDHASPTQKQLIDLRTSKPDLILCTEKDWVKGAAADAYVSLNFCPLNDFAFDKF